jgi:hypothetical protein
MPVMISYALLCLAKRAPVPVPVLTLLMLMLLFAALYHAAGALLTLLVVRLCICPVYR